MLGLNEGYLDRSNLKYYNRSSKNSHRDLKGLIFLSEKSLQSAELNELQEYQYANNKKLADKHWKTGDLIEGGLISLTYDAPDIAIKLDKGEIYLNGLVIDINAGMLNITNSGIYTIGVGITSTLVYNTPDIKVDPTKDVLDEDDEYSLKNPAVGAANYNQYGAGRIDIVGSWVLQSDFVENEDEGKFFFPIYTIEDGSLMDQHQENIETAELVRDIISRYDNAANGSYVVSGFKTSFANNDELNKNHIITVSGGECRVNGYSVIKNESTIIKVPYNEETETINDYHIELIQDGSGNKTYGYSLNHTPIYSVSEIEYIKKVEETLVFNNANAAYDLSNINVLEIVEIKKGASVVSDSEYSLVNDQLIFSDEQTEFTDGDSILITYLYKYTTSDLNGVIDYNIQGDITITNDDGIWFGDLDGAANSNPYLEVTYDYSIPRLDRIIVEQNGNIAVLVGEPNNKTPLPPETGNTLGIATVLVSINKDPIIDIDFTRNYKMEDIKNLFERIENIEYNITRMALLDSANVSDDYSVKKNIFVDSFENDDLRDKGEENNGQNLAFVNDSELTIGAIDGSSKQFSFIRNGLQPFSLTTASEPRDILNQDWVTGTRKVNEFAWSTEDLLTSMSVTPSMHRFLKDGAVYQRSQTNETGRGNRSSTSVSTTTRIIDDETPRTLDDSLEITLVSENFNAGENVNLFIDRTTEDTPTSTFVADANGIINTTYTLPSGTISGLKNIILYGVDSLTRAESALEIIPQATENTTTTTIERWQETIRTVTRTVTRTVVQRIQPVINITIRPIRVFVIRIWRPIRRDPLAQTFVPNNNSFLKDVLVNFRNIPTDADNTPVVCHLVPTIVGIPDRNNVIEEIETTIGDLRAQLGDGGEFLFEFGGYSYLEQNKEYAIIINTDNAIIELDIARLGDRDDNKNRRLMSQADSTGVLLQSANASTWSPIQNEDMTIRIRTKQFTPDVSEEQDLVSYNVENITSFSLTTTDIVPIGTGITYYVEFDSGLKETIIPGVPITIPKYTGTLKFSVDMITIDPNISPMVSPYLNLNVSEAANESEYVSKMMKISGANNIKAYVDIDTLQESELYEIQWRKETGGVASEWASFEKSSIVSMNEGEYIEAINESDNVFDSTDQEYGYVQFRIKLFTIDDNPLRPHIRNLRVVLV